jgi:hypothetical protein
MRTPVKCVGLETDHQRCIWNTARCDRTVRCDRAQAKDSTGWERQIVQLAEKNLLMKETFCVSCGIRKPSVQPFVFVCVYV